MYNKMTATQKQDYAKFRNMGFPALAAKILATPNGIGAYSQLMELGFVCVNQDKTPTILDYPTVLRRNLMSKREI
jgi:hypothetical protein